MSSERREELDFVLVKRYCSEDYSELVSLLEEARFKPWSQGQYADELKTNPDRIIIARTPLSNMAGCVFTSPDEEDLYVTNLVVRADYRRQGIGEALIKETVKIAQNKQLSTINLTAMFGKTELIEYYKKLGFEQKGPNSRHMELKLRQPLLV